MNNGEAYISPHNPTWVQTSDQLSNCYDYGKLFSALAGYSSQPQPVLYEQATTVSSSFLCTRCFGKNPDNVNWCVRCGELLLGADVLLAETHVEHSSQPSKVCTDLFNPQELVENGTYSEADISPSAYSVPSNQFGIIHNSFQFSYDANSRFETNLPMASNLESPDLGSKLTCDFSLVASSDLRHITKPVAPENNYSPALLQDKTDEHVLRSTCDSSKLGMSHSLSDETGNIGNSYGPTLQITKEKVADRQRCVSGPTSQLESVNELVPLKVAFPSVCDKVGAKVPFDNQNYRIAPGMQHVRYLRPIEPVFTPLGHRFVNRSRRKTASETSKTDKFNINAPYQDAQRTQSYSSVMHSTDLPLGCKTYLPPAHRHPNWQSARSLWSARNPSLLKKKPAAYLRNYYSRDSRVQYKQPNSPGPTVEPSQSKCIASSSPPPLNVMDNDQNVPPVTDLSHDQPDQLICDIGICRSEAIHGCNKEHNQIPERSSSPKHSSSIPCPEIESSLVSQLNTCRLTPTATWMSFPDELWLSVLRLLNPLDRSRVAMTCRRMRRLVLDRSLWRKIELHRRHNLTHSMLTSIGQLCPRELHLYNCRGDTIAVDALQSLFAACGQTLRRLDFVGCSRGLFAGDLPLLLVAEHCPNLNHLNVSYTQAVADRTLTKLAKSALRLISVKLNGAQHITSSSIKQLVRYHNETLECLELFGCFRLNSEVFTSLGRCQRLRSLAFGHLHRLSPSGLLGLVQQLPYLSSLDLRGTNALATEDNLVELATNCPQLEVLVLANMSSLKSENGLVKMIRRLPHLRILDLCGLAAVGDDAMEALVSSCPKLEELDVSSTSVTKLGLFHLSRSATKCMRHLSISNCRGITRDVLEKLVRSCPSLTSLFAYGFSSIKNWDFLRLIRPNLEVKSN